MTICLWTENHGIRSKAKLDDIVEKSLRNAAIWDETKDRLKTSALGMSGGQQQRLCIARALAVQPDILLMDEPTSALDPISTSKIEDLCMELKKDYTIIIVTHNMQQAARISDKTAFFLLGEVIEMGETDQIFSCRRMSVQKTISQEGLVDNKMRDYYEEQLTKLHTQMIAMGSLCEKAIADATKALTDGDIALAKEVMDGDAKINQQERDIEAMCIKLLLHQQPVAGDLRRVSAALKMVTDMERVGDQAPTLLKL